MNAADPLVGGPFPVSNLWLRLAILDQTCSVSITRDRQADDAGVRPWRVVIGRHPRGDSQIDSIELAGQNLGSLLLETVEQAQARGWLADHAGAAASAHPAAPQAAPAPQAVPPTDAPASGMPPILGPIPTLEM